MNKQNIFVGRQPIYNPNLGVFAYELLFRSDKEHNSSEFPMSGDAATSQVFINTFFEMGLENVVGDRLACINLGNNYQLWNDIPTVQTERVILDIPNDILINDDSLLAIKNLHEQGYTLALEDCTNNPDALKFIDYASIIRIDVRFLSHSDIKKRVKKYQRFPVKLLADKVENLDDFDVLNAMGFAYFQGYFLSHPKIVASKGIPNNKLSVINLLSSLNDPKAEPVEIEEAIDHDASLSYKMLKLINSAGFGVKTNIDSIHHAIVMLGRRQLISWASMLALGSLNDRPPEMIHLCMIRAKTCELLAQTADIKTIESFFTVGLFSALDILMERPLKTILKPLPLTNEVRSALLEHDGILGEALKATLAFEISDWDNVNFQNIKKRDLLKINIEAFKWANDVAQSLK